MRFIVPVGLAAKIVRTDEAWPCPRPLAFQAWLALLPVESSYDRLLRPGGPLHTRITELLGVTYPIVQGGMMWVGTADLAAAVSNGGGFGIITALTQPTPEALWEEIGRCRTLTDRPFGVNLTMLPSINPPPYELYLDVIVRSKVTAIETAGKVPPEFIATARAAGLKVIHKCVSLRHAQSAQKHGVDAISIDGFECAGHPGDDDVGGLVLIPAAARHLSVPVIASGGIGDGRGMAAALTLGADGVNMGTRFCVTREAPIHDIIKQALVAASERDTRLIFRTMHNTARVLRNAISEEVVAAEAKGARFDDIRHLVAGQRGREALAQGDPNGGVIAAGQVVGLIEDIPTCAELIERMVRECRARAACHPFLSMSRQKAMFQGEAIRVSALDQSFAELCFDRQGCAINKFDKRTVSELQQAIAAISARAPPRCVDHERQTVVHRRCGHRRLRPTVQQAATGSHVQQHGLQSRVPCARGAACAGRRGVEWLCARRWTGSGACRRLPCGGE